jgi:hypothetical protein
MAIQDIINFLESDPMLKQKRNEAIAERERQVGYKPTSAAVPPANDANPTHRGDFMHLVNAAARRAGNWPKA